ncbi:hypothetical protein A1O3_05910 [Capronia epimyces CBS 606.96]|uniref:Nuclease S1 n=1 Tax=Capronia epimyces CBS 606.96 TaxID=1182542 RepID=W9Y6H5_9EURO|nr:uncharacterized protein A1O3_05910 [Capronia epimyces CBS 606.96]EXJ85235.1 hypothetical protein A1O3_05910 [Capronia epimyces CBS 606.96]
MLPSALVPLLCLWLPFASAWGSLGHRTVAYLASMYFTTPSTVMTNHLLNGQDISEAALFADKVRHMPQFAWSAGWHYIDARDDPPRYCGINMTRDCGHVSGDSDNDPSGGCVVTAIANHTRRVADLSLPPYYRGQSLRFMMHFFGDVHQPLHTEAEDRGGNEYAVVFDGKATNLHSVWDTLIPNKQAARTSHNHDDNEMQAARTNREGDEMLAARTNHQDDEMLAAWEWARALYDDHEDQFQSQSHPLDHECLTDSTRCALQWATEANAHVCSYVLAKDVHGQDLGGEYYEGAVPIINDMVAKAGRRLAAWINSISESAKDDGTETLLRAQT